MKIGILMYREIDTLLLQKTSVIVFKYWRSLLDHPHPHRVHSNHILNYRHQSIIFALDLPTAAIAWEH